MLTFFCPDLGGYDDRRRNYLPICCCPHISLHSQPIHQGKGRGNGCSAWHGLLSNSSARCPNQTCELRWPNVPQEAMDHFCCIKASTATPLPALQSESRSQLNHLKIIQALMYAACSWAKKQQGHYLVLFKFLLNHSNSFLKSTTIS